MQKLTLYSRQDCPLCEDLEEILINCNISYKFIDIDDDVQLRLKYHTSIPVLVNTANEQLSWPITEQQVLKFSGIHQ